MTLGLSLSLTQTTTLSQKLAQSFGETSGDIPVYSLHKIARLLRQKPVSVSTELQVILKRSLIVANAGYKEASGNDWNCLTSNNLISAIEETETEVITITDSGIASIPKELIAYRRAAKKLMDQKRGVSMTAIKEWFKNNYEALLYDMSGKVPWPVVQRLRRNLGLWILGTANPFDQGIEEMVCEVAAEAGLPADDAEDAWEAMGGTLFTDDGSS